MDFEDDSTPSFLQLLNMGYTPPSLHPGENQGAAFHGLLQSPGIGGVPMGGGKGKPAPTPAPTSPVPTREDLAAQTLAAPATIPGSGDLRSMVDKIFAHANEVRTPNYTPATSPVFGPADPELTKSLVPQRSIASQLPPMPDPSKALPLNDRARQIMEKTPEIGARMAEDIRNTPSANVPFYSTGSVLQGLMDRAGMSPEQAFGQLFDWAGQGAATSPRTATPSNLRNSSYLLYRQAQGDPLTPEKWLAQNYGTDEKGNIIHNQPGFPLIGGMHVPLSQDFFNNTVDPWSNPKPYTFREDWTGNMADVTADTHNIRKILDTYDQLYPGQLNPGWFNKPANYTAYSEAGGFPSEGKLPKSMKINDTLGGAMIPQPGGPSRYAQTEYPVMQGPTNEAARILGISPAEAQERLWFQGGPRTGLKSPPMTIPDLLNSQYEKTGTVTGMDPVNIMRLWAKRQIPLAEADQPDIPGASAVG